MKNIIRIYNLTVRFSKFTLNIEIYKELVWRETWFFVDTLISLSLYNNTINYIIHILIE